MYYLRLALLLALCSLFTVQAQRPKRLTSSEIYESVQKLNVLASVLYVAAHPDDENTRLIAYMSNEIKARTAYLSITRGDGGQNLIGPELRELLGVIRTQELLAARRVDGGEQMFTRANDFGYSKHPDETFNIWDNQEVLADVVWAIRRFKPDIIINRFDHRTPGTTHGHHTGSAMLSVEAFEMANDATEFPEQLNHADLWQPHRLFFNTSWWFYGSRKKFEEADKSNMLSFDIGVYYPGKGMSNNEIAALASSQHLCQGFGRLLQRGSQDEYIELLKGEPLLNNVDPFSGIDITWNRVKGGETIGRILEKVEQNFNFKNPSSHIPDLIEAYKLLQKINNEHWKALKSKELIGIIEACAGLYLEASAFEPTAAPLSEIEIRLEALNRSTSDIKLESYRFSTHAEGISKSMILSENQRKTFQENLTLDANIDFTAPYWLNKKSTLGMYHVDRQDWIGLPETPRAVMVDFNLLVEGTPITISKPLVHRYSRSDKGELYRPFEIIPAASASLDSKVIMFSDSEPKEIIVNVKAGKNNLKGTVKLAYPNDWQVIPEAQSVEIANKDDIQKVKFTLIPPEGKSEGLLTPIVEVDGKSYTDERIDIDYDHIPFQTVLLPSVSKIVRLDIEKGGTNIGYIEGAGDTVPESLRQMGYTVSLIEPKAISPELLTQFDAVVVGIRAYNVVDDLKFKQRFLLEYVENGGNLVIQYNTNRGLKTETLAPFNLKLSRDRVTDENAEVRILNPNHPVLNFPNKITEKDFEGWVQERGLYFPNEWSQEYTPLLEMNDKGESPKKGSLLVTQYGKGHYIYTGLSFFREFPAGVPGAFRLFANFLAAGEADKGILKN